MNSTQILVLVCLAIVVAYVPTVTSAASFEDIVLSSGKLRSVEKDVIPLPPSYGIAIRPDGRVVLLHDRTYVMQKKFDSLSGGTFGLQKREVSLETMEKSS